MRICVYPRHSACPDGVIVMQRAWRTVFGTLSWVLFPYRSQQCYFMIGHIPDFIIVYFFCVSRYVYTQDCFWKCCRVSHYTCVMRNVNFTENKTFNHNTQKVACVCLHAVHWYAYLWGRMHVQVTGTVSLYMYYSLFPVHRTKNSLPKDGWWLAISEHTVWLWGASSYSIKKQSVLRVWAALGW